MFHPEEEEEHDSFYCRLANEWNAGMRCNADGEIEDTHRREVRRGDGSAAAVIKDFPQAVSPHHTESPEKTFRHAGQMKDDADHLTLKREIMRESNKFAARKCRQKKKEYVKCLETRVASLERQNKTLIEELNTLKEFYCVKTG